MLRIPMIRRAIATIALAATLVPGPALARRPATASSGGEQTDTIVGAIAGMACGASAGVARRAPLPIVVTVTAFVCALMIIDALSSPDPH